MKLANVLGLNARSQLFAYKYNNLRSKKVADSKIQTARILANAGVPTPQLYQKFRNAREIFNFDWLTLPDSFALKPSKGLGGEGIIVIKKRSEGGEGYITTQRKKVTPDDLKLHALDIVEGAFSMTSEPDVALVQEYVGRHKAFRKYAYRGTPDIRIIVFNKVPVMAMLRLPTKESGGRANMFQGAIAVGVDIATGITTRAVLHGDLITYKPGTKRKLRGIKIPNWTEVLETAVKAQIASGLGYLGVDIVLHPEKGPQVLELNAQPGLKIQLANMAGLKKRLERVEDLEVRDAEHGVKIAKALFASSFATKVKPDESLKIIEPVETVKVLSASGKKEGVLARIDTGAVRSSIDKGLADKLGLMTKENILWKDRYEYRSATGLQTRPVIGITFWLGGKKKVTSASVADRSKMQYKMLIGRRDMSGFLVKPEFTGQSPLGSQ